MNLFYVRLNKCVLFNNKQNGMASIKMKVHTVQHSTFKINKFLKCKQITQIYVSVSSQTKKTCTSIKFLIFALYSKRYVKNVRSLF